LIESVVQDIADNIQISKNYLAPPALPWKQPGRGGKAKKPTSSQQKKIKGGTVTPRQKPAKQIIFNNKRHHQQPTFELNDSSNDDEQAAGDRRVGAAILDNVNHLHTGRGLDQGSSSSAEGGDGFVEQSAPVLSTATVSDNNSSSSGDSNKNEINTFLRRLLDKQNKHQQK